ncbi:MAG: VCBS repeat-containing protein [Lachnospiraceae bacterium]|nr:VCBS repeat-containing protein [Lachnospiraceae bacterium]
MALFFASPQGDICYTTDRLAANYQNRGILKQTNEGIAAVSFQDMNEDGLTDIILITFCKEPGKDAGKLDKVGDVLFQGAEGFYRDWRLSDKLNRFHMNKSAGFVRSFVKDNYSTEFLYTTVTLKGLLSHGFEPIKEQCSWQDFEKLGKLKVVPGIYKMAEYYIFMVYLVNEQGYIVQSFQPMGDYENLYSLQEISCCDIDGDGMKDLVILGNYSYEGSGGEMLIEKDYSVFYQQTGGFREDIEIKDEIFCHEDTNMEELLKQAWSYWGWGLFEEKEANEK